GGLHLVQVAAQDAGQGDGQQERQAEVHHQQEHGEAEAPPQQPPTLDERVEHGYPTSMCISRRFCSQNIQRADHLSAARRDQPSSSTQSLLAGLTSMASLPRGSTIARTTLAGPRYLNMVQRYCPSHDSSIVRPSEKATMTSTDILTPPSRLTVTSESHTPPFLSSGGTARGEVRTGTPSGPAL